MSPELVTLAIFASAMVGAVALFYVASELLNGPVRGLRTRVARMQERSLGPKLEEGVSGNLRLVERDSSFSSLDALFKRIFPRRAPLRERLSKTGRALTAGNYIMICLTVGALAMIVMSAMFGFPLLLSLFIGVMAGVGLPHLVINFLIARRIKQFTSQFPGAIDLIVRGLRSGLPVPESIRSVGEEFDGPVGEEFHKVANTTKLGQPLEEALWDAAKRLDTQDFRFFVISLAVQRETGGNLAETLENLSEILRKRFQMYLKIKAMSAEAKASALILGALPFVMFGILFLVNSPYVMTLFSDPRGLFMVAGGMFSLLIGVFIMAKMVSFEV